MTILNTFLFQLPSSIFLWVMSIIIFTSLVYSGLSEISGRHFGYSKFWNADDVGGSVLKQIRIPSKMGMLLLYSPAMAYAVAATFVFFGPIYGIRARFVAAALAVHFTKRVFEVLFIHQFSGYMGLDAAIIICSGYFFSTLTTIYAQHLTQNMAEPAVDFKYVGVLLFLIGIFGNFYHHYILSKLRVKGEKVYKIPKGGLFDLVICPHYLFEIIGFVGISLISQTLYSFPFTLGSIIYLIGRSYATRQWYLSKFDDFPKHVKALIPYVF